MVKHIDIRKMASKTSYTFIAVCIFIFSSILVNDCRVINCGGPFDDDICDDAVCNPPYYGWCDEGYNHHCCCPETAPVTKTCSQPEPCHYVCCDWPEKPCGYDCCQPNKSANKVEKIIVVPKSIIRRKDIAPKLSLLLKVYEYF